MDEEVTDEVGTTQEKVDHYITALIVNATSNARNLQTELNRISVKTKAFENLLRNKRPVVGNFIIHEEPEFVWESGSNSEPETPRPLDPA